MTASDQDPKEDPFDIAPGARIWVGGNDRDSRGFVEGRLRERGAVRPPEGPIDTAFVTPQSADEAIHFLSKLAPRLAADAKACVVVSSERARNASDPPPVGVEGIVTLLRSNGWIVLRNSRTVDEFHCISVTRSVPD